MLQASQTVDETERENLYKEIEQTVLEDAPVCTLMWRMQGYALSDSLKGFVNLPNGIFPSSGYLFNKMYLEK
ncbi:hypothetical protein SDC9_184060 [bioreactor metagenome]|uniref:Uncharacterized protein n=1 Tax=bioreactor metagenome TaxID=1076179 RepID=A0A645HBY6_9ZZZZ